MLVNLDKSLTCGLIAHFSAAKPLSLRRILESFTLFFVATVSYRRQMFPICFPILLIVSFRVSL